MRCPGEGAGNGGRIMVQHLHQSAVVTVGRALGHSSGHTMGVSHSLSVSIFQDPMSISSDLDPNSYLDQESKKSYPKVQVRLVRKFMVMSGKLASLDSC